MKGCGFRDFIYNVNQCPYFPVLASEEYKAPYVALVKSGEAIVMKQINVAIYMPGGKRVCTLHNNVNRFVALE